MASKVKRDARRLQPFRCHRCGNCCSIEGYVRVFPDDAERIARYLGISIPELRQQYMTRTKEGGWSLVDHAETTDCIMLTSDRLCRIHPVKPEQCKNFPMRWRNQDAKSYCESLSEDKS